MKIAVITGASSGLGAEFTRAVAEQGGLDEIWIVARRKERLEALAKECSPANVRPIPMDLTDRKSFAAISDMLREEHADIKILINNAGCCICGSFEDMPEKSIEMMIDLDITAMTLINKVCIPLMIFYFSATGNSKYVASAFLQMENSWSPSQLPSIKMKLGMSFMTELQERQNIFM